MQGNDVRSLAILDEYMIRFRFQVSGQDLTRRILLETSILLYISRLFKQLRCTRIKIAMKIFFAEAFKHAQDLDVTGNWGKYWRKKALSPRMGRSAFEKFAVALAHEATHTHTPQHGVTAGCDSVRAARGSFHARPPIHRRREARPPRHANRAVLFFLRYCGWVGWCGNNSFWQRGFQGELSYKSRYHWREDYAITSWACSDACISPYFFSHILQVSDVFMAQPDHRWWQRYEENRWKEAFYPTEGMMTPVAATLPDVYLLVSLLPSFYDVFASFR